MAVAAAGFFDGVHLGHRAVIETLVRTARERGEESLVLTFWPHPRIVLGSAGEDFRLLETLEEKTARLRSLGVDRVEVAEFTKEFASLTAAKYLQNIRKEYGITCLVLGYDNHMGSDCLGPQEIASVCKGLGISTIIVSPVEVNSGEGPVTVSSTKIRRALSGGDSRTAELMLGRNK